MHSRARRTDWRPRNKFTGEKEDLRLVMTSAATGLSDLRRQFSQPLFILLGVAGIVLLIACANVGNLVLARSATRRAEFALRLALGAGRGRLIRQVLVEGLVLAGLAGVAGVALAIGRPTRSSPTLHGQGAIVLDLWPDLRVLAFTAGVSALAGLLFATIPAFARRAPTNRAKAGSIARVRGVGAAWAGQGPCRPADGALARAPRRCRLVRPQPAKSEPARHRRRSAQRPGRRTVEPRGSGQRNIPGTAERLDVMYRDLLAQMERLPAVRSASLARSSPLGQTGYGYRLVPAAGGDAQMLTATIVYPRRTLRHGHPGRPWPRFQRRRPSARRAGRGAGQRSVRPDIPRRPGHAWRDARRQRGDGPQDPGVARR